MLYSISAIETEKAEVDVAMQYAHSIEDLDTMDSAFPTPLLQTSVKCVGLLKFVLFSCAQAFLFAAQEITK